MITKHHKGNQQSSSRTCKVRKTIENKTNRFSQSKTEEEEEDDDDQF